MQLKYYPLFDRCKPNNYRRFNRQNNNIMPTPHISTIWFKVDNDAFGSKLYQTVLDVIETESRQLMNCLRVVVIADKEGI